MCLRSQLASDGHSHHYIWFGFWWPILNAGLQIPLLTLHLYGKESVVLQGPPASAGHSLLPLSLPCVSPLRSMMPQAIQTRK